MKIKHLLLSAIAVATALVSCQKDPSKEKASLTLSDSEISFETSAEGTKTVTLTSTRMWEAQIPTAAAEWVSVSPDKGEASANPQTIEITVKDNGGFDHSADITFKIRGGFRILKVLSFSKFSGHNLEIGDLSEMLLDGSLVDEYAFGDGVKVVLEEWPCFTKADIEAEFGKRIYAMILERLRQLPGDNK